tara:strand:+ start:1663 stop:1839 length:177 start_codon:yes stop_codon:yes gene_type:complete
MPKNVIRKSFKDNYKVLFSGDSDLPKTKVTKVMLCKSFILNGFVYDLESVINADLGEV